MLLLPFTASSQLVHRIAILRNPGTFNVFLSVTGPSKSILNDQPRFEETPVNRADVLHFLLSLLNLATVQGLYYNFHVFSTRLHML